MLIQRFAAAILCLAVLRPSPAVAQQVQEFHIKVQVQGAVRHPGIYSLFVGARVAELLQTAGGPRKDADLAGLNLTRVLSDGEACQVPLKVAAATPAPFQVAAAPHKKGHRRARKGGKSHAKKSHRTGVKEKKSGARVHLNSATAEQLQELPGVGEGLATAILEQRKKMGRFRALEDLREVAGLGQKRLERIRPHAVLD